MSLGYAIAWKDGWGHVQMCSHGVQPLDKAKALLAAEKIKWPTLDSFLVEVHSAAVTEDEGVTA